MWMQVVAKVVLGLTPGSNHFWSIAFHLTPRGLTTLPMTAAGRTFTISFDFVAHEAGAQLANWDRAELERR